jgi:hypothetical protein
MMKSAQPNKIEELRMDTMYRKSEQAMNLCKKETRFKFGGAKAVNFTQIGSRGAQGRIAVEGNHDTDQTGLRNGYSWS